MNPESIIILSFITVRHCTLSSAVTMIVKEDTNSNGFRVRVTSEVVTSPSTTEGLCNYEQE